MPVPFDTLELAERLGAGGFTTQQAQTASSALADVLSTDIATKPDVEMARLALQADIDKTKQQLQADIDKTKQQLQADIDKLKQQLQAEIDKLKQQLKSDIDAVKLQIEGVRLQLEAKIEKSHGDTIKWVAGMIGFQTLVILGTVVGLLKIFVK